MKNLFLKAIFVIALLSGTVVYAQDVQLATLQQGENLQVFYGVDAFKNAAENAEHGDLITLSAGTFNAGFNITKAVTIQGAGYITDIENNKYPTIINNKFTVILPEDQHNFLMEGVMITDLFTFANKLTGATLKKCKIYRVSLAYHNYQSVNCLIDQCRIWSFEPDHNSENLHLRNSITYSIGNNSSTATFFVENCVIMNNVPHNITAYFKNNIMGGVNYHFSDSYSLSSNSIAYNNVFIRGSADDVVIKENNKSVTSDELFGKDIHSLEGYYGYEDNNEKYQLTENAKSVYLGVDKTQVGIYGGESPFTDIPTNPQIIEKRIDTKSTPDGKLNVNIKVEAQ